MKWFEVAQLLAPLVGLLIPGSAPVIPLIIRGVTEAEAIPGATGADKKAHVLNLVAASAEAETAIGTLTIPPAAALQIANAVFQAVDGVRAVVLVNQVQVPPAL
jgi:hypothetical protein